MQLPDSDSESQLDLPIISGDEAQPNDDASALLFVERRRTRSLEHAWHEALEPLHQLLIGYEQLNRQLMEAEEKYRGIFEDALIGIFQVSCDGRPLSINRSMARLCGYETPEQMMAEVSNVGEQLLVDTRGWRDFTSSIEVSGFRCGIEAEIRCADGEQRWVRLNVRAVRGGDGRITHFEGTGEDITDRKKAEDRIQLLAYYDAVTGLPNRPLLTERLKEVLAAADLRNGSAALILLELDRFKIINDSLGEPFGDRLLQEIAERIRKGAGEDSIVARVAGAEFAIILPDFETTQQIETTAQNIIDELLAEFSFLGHSLNVSCTMGISLYPENGTEGDMLLKRADVAMYSAKEQGTNQFRFFSQEMNFQILERLKLENGLRLALERNELFLVYQPQVDSRTGAITGLEALLRWQHPQLGVVPPAKFIGVAENSGLIVPIGEWVLRTACTQARKWQDAGLPAVPVAVNVSAIQFRHQGFRELVRQVLQETGLDPKYLELEVTEGLLLTNADVMFAIIQELREMGVKLAIDDFGTGYSSLGYLRQFKVNRLKIDRSFVRDVPLNADDAAITTAIIKMARALNLEVLAEGVENAEQLAFLREHHCYAIQGYYFSKPVTVEQVAEQLQSSFAHSE